MALNVDGLRLLFVVAGVLLLAGCATPRSVEGPVTSPATTAEAAGLVDIRALVPDIAEDIKYAGSGNFVGVPVDGYTAPRCFLLRPAADALAKVERTLREDNLRLRIWDCYRPVRAVQHFVRWAEDVQDQRTKAAHYPNLDKGALLGDYIAPVSGHSRGATLDLTLMQCDDAGRDCKPLDMGTDCEHRLTRCHAAATRQPRSPAHRNDASGLPQLPDGMVALHAGPRTHAAHAIRRAGGLEHCDD